MSKKFNDETWEKYTNGVLKTNTNNTTKIKGLLDSKGCGFCLAKFKQVTMHLGTGMTHSCHHPTPHKIPLSEINENPAALFNTNHLKDARKQMINNERPSECEYCWRIEDDGGVSDRLYKSLEGWASDHYDEIAELKGDENIFPSYLEVSFSNVCNMKCTYCGPAFSSKWVEELKKEGPYTLLKDTNHEFKHHEIEDLENLNYRTREINPYIDAFWKWFPDALPHLRHYRITGGEPLMSKETFRSMDWMIENPNTQMEFSVNSNLSVPDKLWDQFVAKLELLRDSGSVKRITIYTSVEGWGKRAEYGRTGLDFELFKKRTEQLAAMDDIRVVIMAAFNIFSITSFKPLLEWVHSLKLSSNPNPLAASIQENTGFMISDENYVVRREANKSHNITFGIDIPYLRHPTHLDVHFCSDDLVTDYLFPLIEYMGSKLTTESWGLLGGFEHYEFDKLLRIVNHRLYFNKKNSPIREGHQDVLKGRASFYDYVNQLDSRNNTNFLETFPEMQEFYDICMASKEKIHDQER